MDFITKRRVFSKTFKDWVKDKNPVGIIKNTQDDKYSIFRIDTITDGIIRIEDLNKNYRYIDNIDRVRFFNEETGIFDIIIANPYEDIDCFDIEQFKNGENGFYPIYYIGETNTHSGLICEFGLDKILIKNFEFLSLTIVLNDVINGKVSIQNNNDILYIEILNK